MALLSRIVLNLILALSWTTVAAMNLHEPIQKAGDNLGTVTLPVAALLLIFKLIIELWDRFGKNGSNGRTQLYRIENCLSELGEKLSQTQSDLRVLNERLTHLYNEIQQLNTRRR